jgi:NAD(P)-dependent dehydrogenase (short-subunit alcohol dehydrogenase family)
MAIEGCTGSLTHELEAFNVRVKLVEPGYEPDHALYKQPAPLVAVACAIAASSTLLPESRVPDYS